MMSCTGIESAVSCVKEWQPHGAPAFAHPGYRVGMEREEVCYDVMGPRPQTEPTCFEVFGYIQVRHCERSVLERARRLLHGFGWPGLNDAPSREYITELLGLRRRIPNKNGQVVRHSAKTSTYLGWAVCQGKTAMVATAILSVYRYRDERRRCGCLEFITSRSRGAGAALVALARRFLSDHQIPRLFSGADLSRPLALKAHKSWCFEAVPKEEWGKAGLALYGRGDVHYMVLNLAPRGPGEAMLQEPLLEEELAEEDDKPSTCYTQACAVPADFQHPVQGVAYAP